MAAAKFPPKQDPFLLKTLAAALAGLLALALLAGLGGPPAYRWFKQKRFLGIARDHLEQRDYAGALFFTSQVLQQNPQNDEAVELVTRILLAQNQPTAVLWAAKWAELDPKDPHRLLTLGKLSLSRGDLKTARTCLAAARKLPGFSVPDATELESGLLVREGKVREALKLLEPEALAPEAKTGLRLNYANLLLLSPDPTQQQAGVLQLKDLAAASEENSRAARRSLLLYALDHQDRSLARESAAAIQEAGLQTAADVFLWAGSGLLLEGRLPPTFQEEAGKVADRTPQALPEIAFWLMSRRLLDPAAALVRARLENQRHQPGIWPLYAECLTAAGDWDTIRSTYPGQNWGTLDAWRLLYLIQASLSQAAGPADPRRNEALWFSLRIELKKNPFQLFPLDRLAASWNWKEERLRLWKIADEAKPVPLPFLKAELAESQKRQDTLALYGLSRQLLRLFPDDKAIRNNAATYGLLLGEDLAANTALAETTAKAHPEDNLLKSTYALALLRAGKPREALEQYLSFPEEQLKRPDVAAYYAMALAANGKAAEAEAYKKLTSPQGLLPEERALLDQALPQP